MMEPSPHRVPHRKGLFLDFDGTLADSLGSMRVAYEQFLNRYEITGTDEEFDQLNGPPLNEIVRRLKQSHNLQPSEAELLATYKDCLLHAYNHVQPAIGTRQLLQAVTEQGWAVAIVTSSYSSSVKQWLKEHQLEEYIPLVVGADSVNEGKPAPEPYLKAMALTGVQPDNGIAVEDTVTGATSACQAGLVTYLIQPLRLQADTNNIALPVDLIALSLNKNDIGNASGQCYSIDSFNVLNQLLL